MPTVDPATGKPLSGARNYWPKRRAMGQCGSCGTSPTLPGKAQCARCIDRSRRYGLKRKYGITPTEFEALMWEQAGLCAICAEPMRPPSSRQMVSDTACLDHDHTTRAIRALVHNACNRGIGYLGDDAARAIAAADYLLLHGAA